MNTIIDLTSGILIDRSQIPNPYLRLLLTAVGQELAKGSPWVAIDKRAVSRYEPLLRLMGRRFQHAAA